MSQSVTTMAVKAKAKTIIVATCRTTAIQAYSTTKPDVAAKHFLWGALDGSKEKKGERLREVNDLAAAGIQVKVGPQGTLKQYHATISDTSLKACLFRSHAADAIAQAYVKENPSMDLNFLLSLKKGIEKTKKSSKKTKDNPTEKAESKKNLNAIQEIYEKSAFFGATGAFNHALDARLRFSEALSVQPVDLEYVSLSRNSQLGESAQLLEGDKLAQLHEYHQVQAQRSSITRALKDLRDERKVLVANKAGDQELAQHDKVIADLESELAKVAKQAEGYDVAMDNTFSRYYVPEGTVFEHSIEVLDAKNPAYLSMLLFGLAQFAKYPRLGAHKNTNGLVSMEITFKEIHDGRAQEFCKVTIGGDYLWDDTKNIESLNDALFEKYVVPALQDSSWLACEPLPELKSK